MIKFGPLEGPYLSPRSIPEVIMPVATEIEKLTGVGEITVWYNKRDDYRHIDFDLDGDHYTVQKYKIWTLTKNGITGLNDRKLFHVHEDRLVRFFRDRQHLDWKVRTGLEPDYSPSSVWDAEIVCERNERKDLFSAYEKELETGSHGYHTWAAWEAAKRSVGLFVEAP